MLMRTPRPPRPRASTSVWQGQTRYHPFIPFYSHLQRLFPPPTPVPSWPGQIYVAFDETNTADHINELVDVFAVVAGKKGGFDAEAVSKEIDTSVPSE